MITNSIEVQMEDKPFDTADVTKEKKEGVIICQKFHKENHFSRDYKANVGEDKAFYLRMVRRLMKGKSD